MLLFMLVTDLFPIIFKMHVLPRGVIARDASVPVGDFEAFVVPVADLEIPFFLVHATTI